MKVEIVSTALEDLKDIRSYIANTLGNSAAAERVIKKIRKSILLISDTPFIGQTLKSKVDVDTSFRFLTSGNYLIFYKIEEKRITINRIIYGKRDYAKILFKTKTEDSEN